MSEQIPEPVDEAEVDPLDDPDLRTADSALDEPDDPDALSTDTLGRDEQDEGGWEPEQHLSNATAELIVNGDGGETLDQRLAQEVPDVDADRGSAVDAERDVREV